MRRISVLLLVVLIAGCSTARLYSTEPADKSNAALIRAVNIKALIRPVQSDVSVRQRLSDDGIWVSGGAFLVEYACLDLNQDPSTVHVYPNIQTLHIEAGYHYDVQCSEDKTKLELENSAWEDFDYKTFDEALYSVPAEVRHLEDEPTDEGGFRYLFYNDYGGSGETNFEIYTDYNTKRLTASLTQYRNSVMYLAIDAYNRGIRNRDAMMKALAPEKFTADVKDCPKLADQLAEVRRDFDVRYTRGPLPSESTEGHLYTDSPEVYRYFLGKGHGATAVLTLTVEQNDLYRATHAVMDYVKTCGTEEKQSN